MALLILDKIWYDHEMAENGGTPTRQRLDLYPFFVNVVFTMFFQLIICIRHATTPKHIYNQWFGPNATLADPKETFIKLTWMQISPSFLIQEINQSMIDVGADPNTFKFKVLSPMFPPIEARLENTDHFATQNWVFKEDMKDRQ